MPAPPVISSSSFLAGELVWFPFVDDYLPFRVSFTPTLEKE